jgi:UDP-glucose 4-epimerase
MRAVVTGAAGFVGYALTELLANEWGPKSVQAVVGPVQHDKERARLERLRRLGTPLTSFDLRQSPVFHTGLADFDVFFHLAAYVRTEVDSADVRINDSGTERLLSELRPMLGGTRFIYTSTIAAVDSPLGGGSITSATPCRPRTDYGVTKLAAEQLLKAAAAEGGFNYTILRLPTVYGPGYRPGGMFDVLAKSLPRNGLSTRILWPGKMAIVQVHDLARILLQASGHPEMRDRTFLVSSDEDPTMGEIAGQVAQAIGVRHRPIVLPQWLLSCLRAVRSPIWQSAALPHWIKILAWRLSLVLDGLYCDGSELTNLLQFKYQPWRQAFERIYAES